jgi:hypothetical protein
MIAKSLLLQYRYWHAGKTKCGPCFCLETPFHGNLYMSLTVCWAHIMLEWLYSSKRRLAVCDKKTSKSSPPVGQWSIPKIEVCSHSWENAVLEQYTHCVEIFNEALSHPPYRVPSAQHHTREHLINVIAPGTGELAGWGCWIQLNAVALRDDWEWILRRYRTLLHLICADFSVSAWLRAACRAFY